MLTELGPILRELGSQLMSLRYRTEAQGEWHGSQLKTEADTIAHRTLSQALADLEPKIAVVSEEDESSQDEQRIDRYWLIDPIDGTASLAGGYTGFVTQVALIEAGRPSLAAIYAPALNLLYLARRGEGASCNGRTLKLASSQARRILIDNTAEPHGTAQDLYTALHCTGYLESGSISLKMCRVADGSADLLVKDVVVRDWDIAAPSLILAEAGGHMCCFDGSRYTFDGPYEKSGIVAASSAALASAAVQSLRGKVEAAHGV